MMKQLILGATMLAATSSLASAQTPSGFRGFADVSIVADVDSNTYSADSDTRPAIAGTIGVALPRNWSVRFEGTLPAWHEEDYDYSYGSGTQKTTESGVERHRISTYSFLFGKEFTVGRRVAVTPLVGLSAARHSDQEDGIVERNRAGVVTREFSNYDAHDMLSTFTVGADVPITLTPRISIVPGFRTHAVLGYEGGFSIWRPGIAFRWRF